MTHGVARADPDLAFVTGGLGREARDHGEVVDHHCGGVWRQTRLVVEHDLDVPGVKGVLVEAEGECLVEAHGHGPEGEGQGGPVRHAHGVCRLEEAPVLDETVVGLGAGRLGVPLVPDCGRVVLGHLGPVAGVLQASLHQHGARAEVRQDVGDRPVAGVGLHLEPVDFEAPHQLVEPGDRGAERRQRVEHRSRSSGRRSATTRRGTGFGPRRRGAAWGRGPTQYLT